MVINKARLEAALRVVRAATEEWVWVGFFPRGVLMRLDQWLKGLPEDREEFPKAVAEMAGKVHTNTGADINGVALDERGQPSLESMVLYYSGLEQTLFPTDSVIAARKKLGVHGGPRYTGPWP